MKVSWKKNYNITGSFENASSSSTLPRTSAASSIVRRPVKEASLKNQKQKEKLPETNETRHLSTQELQRLVLLEQLQVFRLAKEILLQKKQDKDSRQDNCDSQGENRVFPSVLKKAIVVPIHKKDNSRLIFNFRGKCFYFIHKMYPGYSLGPNEEYKKKK
ncbi:unnamed protein product [Acanthoscelides obtectus]|uniref:Uncharacterized protein n=1 Tax=Acanthoscelides obtectus TaxID=200917 RepID=A0A9P0PPZ5_ACAOB|nr:unnamed protein product [Acanthoscelides obtectus]CAK1649088.1 hypothetical protein AOBTE_LOCUS16031 [Acanthoscelides obtectus]